MLQQSARKPISRVLNLGSFRLSRIQSNSTSAQRAAARFASRQQKIPGPLLARARDVNPFRDHQSPTMDENSIMAGTAADNDAQVASGQDAPGDVVNASGE